MASLSPIEHKNARPLTDCLLYNFFHLQKHIHFQSCKVLAFYFYLLIIRLRLRRNWQTLYIVQLQKTFTTDIPTAMLERTHRFHYDTGGKL